ncbi:hypothetical protein QJS66_18500 [Kocuria rhizophila]|nr:hypothetical protein QJS66_18500 [Kocuria rhizophila]
MTERTLGMLWGSRAGTPAVGVRCGVLPPRGSSPCGSWPRTIHLRQLRFVDARDLTAERVLPGLDRGAPPGDPGRAPTCSSVHLGRRGSRLVRVAGRAPGRSPCPSTGAAAATPGPRDAAPRSSRPPPRDARPQRCGPVISMHMHR